MTPGISILKQGRNCWRIEEANRLGFLVDGAAYFESLAASISQAKRTIYIAGWDIDSRIHLFRREPGQKRSLPLGEFFNRKVAQAPGLHVYLLCWDFAMIYALEREWFPLFRLGWKAHRRIHFHLDDEHPTGGSQHQKIIVIDDSVAFCGGFDLTKNRWDNPEHRPDDPRRTDPNGKLYGPFHDVQWVVDGNAGRALGDLFRDRWLWATGERLYPTRVEGSIPWPQHLDPDLTNVWVAVARTLPSYKGRQEVREVLTLYRDSMLAAEKYIYVENQYLTSASVADALTRSLKQEYGPEIVIVLPLFAGGWLEQSTMEAIQGRILKHLFEADHHNRLRVYYPALENKDISLMVHSKVMVVDDSLARTGSANLSNRSMGLDSECDLAVEADGDPRVEKGIALFRNRLVAELHVSTAQVVDESLKETGSLIMTIENLSGRSRTLKPLDFRKQQPIDGPALVGNTTLLDPEQPIKLDQMIDQFVLEEESPSRKFQLVKAASLLLILLALAAAWHWTPLSQWLSMDRLTGWGTSIEEGSFSLLTVVGAYLVGGILMVPITLLVAVTATVFDPLLGIIYALVGCLSSALVSYGIGREVGKNTIRRIAGQRLNRLSRRLANQRMLTIALIRNLPVAPFTIVNMVAGATRIALKDYLLGTALGMLPGIVAIALFTDRLIAAFKKPHWTNIAFAAGLALCLGIAIWWTKKRISRDTDK